MKKSETELEKPAFFLPIRIADGNLNVVDITVAASLGVRDCPFIVNGLHPPPPCPIPAVQTPPVFRIWSGATTTIPSSVLTLPRGTGDSKERWTFQLKFQMGCSS